MSKKEIATQFLEMASSGDVREAYDRYIHGSFLHHNAYFKGDRQALMTAMEENVREYPEKHDVFICFGEDLNLHAENPHYPLKLISGLSSPLPSLPFSFDKYIPFIELIKVGESGSSELFHSILCCFESELVTQLVTRNPNIGKGRFQGISDI
jgi:hypothetical protein